MEMKGMKIFKAVFAQNKPAVAVEIGNDWLKIAEGSFSGQSVVFSKFSFKKLSQIKGSLAEQLASDFRELKLSKKGVVTFIPRHMVTSRVLEVPSVDHKEIGEILNLQIGKQTPYSKEEIVSDYNIISSPREGYTKVMLIIARRNLIDERLEVFSKAGIEIEAITLSSEGVYNWFNVFHSTELKAQDPTGAILVDIDSNYSDFLVINDKNFTYSKNILIGANHLIEDRQNYQQKFIEELKHSKDVYAEEWKGSRIAKLFLCGAAAEIKDLDHILSAQLDISCQVIDSGRDMRLNPAISGNSDYKFISFCPLLGILKKHKALKFNLIPNEMRIQRLIKEKRDNLTILGVLFGAVMMVVSLLALMYIHNKNDYLAQIKGKVSLIQKDSDEVDKMRQSLNLIRERLSASGDSLVMLNELYRVLPKEVYLTGLSIERKKQITIRGRASAMSDVFRFVTALENSPSFQNVKNNYATAKKENEVEFTDFEIVANYEKPKD